MGKPKLKKYNSNIYGSKEGNERVEELLAMTDPHSTYLPPSITIEDIDLALFKLVSEGKLMVTADGSEIPCIFMTNERWGEFSQTWKLTDDDKNISHPFITVTKSDAAQGTYWDTKYSIPNKKPFRYLRVPTFENGKQGYDEYKIPQPTAIDLSYEVTLFCKMQMDVNTMIDHYFSTFSDRQLYMNVHGYYFPVLLEDHRSNDNIEDIEGDKYYSKIFELKVMAFLQNKDNFIVQKSVNRILTTTEVIGDDVPKDFE